MDINCYALESLAKSRLAELRADAARHVALAAVRERGSGVWAAVRSALLRRYRLAGRRGTVRPRPA
jgi:hypothetical protein